MSDLKDQQGTIDKLSSALGVMLDCVDYTAGNCRVNEPVGGVLPKEIIAKAKEALQDTRRLTRDAPATGQTCPFCEGTGLDEEPDKYGKDCIWCDGTGQVKTP